MQSSVYDVSTKTIIPILDNSKCTGLFRAQPQLSDSKSIFHSVTLHYTPLHWLLDHSAFESLANPCTILINSDIGYKLIVKSRSHGEQATGVNMPSCPTSSPLWVDTTRVAMDSIRVTVNRPT